MSDIKMGHIESTAWHSPREIAIRRLSDAASIQREIAEYAVDLILKIFEEPDGQMISAGIGALEQAMTRRRPIEQRELVELIFRAMLGRTG